MVILISLSYIPAYAYEEDIPVNFLVNGKKISFDTTPVIRNGVTYVDLKSIARALSLNHVIYPGHDSIVVSNKRVSICFVPNDGYATVADLTGTSDSEYYYKILTAPCVYIDGSPAVAARDISSVFGYALSFNQDTNTVYFGYSPDMISAATRDNIASKAYYFQNQDEFNLPSHGSGYCWTCSYAMLMTNVTGTRITPNDVASINMSKGASGNYCYHQDIISAYNLRFVSAISTNSPYYGGRDNGSGGTYIKNPGKDDYITRQALKEALTLHPEGVMVRYKDFPHTIVAVAFDGDTILFNDPAPSTSSSYSSKGKYQGVPFSETCVAKRGFILSDVTFIQALSY